MALLPSASILLNSELVFRVLDLEHEDLSMIWTVFKQTLHLQTVNLRNIKKKWVWATIVNSHKFSLQFQLEVAVYLFYGLPVSCLPAVEIHPYSNCLLKMVEIIPLYLWHIAMFSRSHYHMLWTYYSHWDRVYKIHIHIYLLGPHLP